MSKLTAMDLFCGAGGLSIGLKRAGFSPSLAVDNWPLAKETFSANFPRANFLLADISQLQTSDLIGASGPPTIIAGGPPCQGFSSAGRREPGDPRNTLVGIFARLVAEAEPPFVLFENVEGFLTAGRGSAVFALLDPLLEAGYQVHLRKVNAANYGVPQLRKRVIAVGALGRTPSFPQPTHSAYGAPGAHLAGTSFPPTPTLEETIGDLERSLLQYDSHIREPLCDVELKRSTALKQGETMKDLPLELQHESYLRRANRRVRDGTPTERRGGAPAGLRRLTADEPSKAITGAAISEFLHPYLHGFLTIRECARLQTFPDEFTFAGSRRERALLVGNAVPPRLAMVLGQSLVCDYYNSDVTNAEPTGGKLLSFIPTLSEGMSPILKDVVDRVGERYGTRFQKETGEQLPLYA